MNDTIDISENINKIVAVIATANMIIENAIIFEDEQGYGGMTPTYLVEKSMIDKLRTNLENFKWVIRDH